MQLSPSVCKYTHYSALSKICAEKRYLCKDLAEIIKNKYKEVEDLTVQLSSIDERDNQILGNNMVEETKESIPKYICTNCGTQYEVPVKFCRKCGHKMEE